MIEQFLKKSVLVLDGAMGTMIQRYNLEEKDYRGSRFTHLSGQMKGNNDMLSISRPDIIRAIHAQYLESGADIIETNSFNSNIISMGDYGMEEYVRELNLEAARIARNVADEYTRKTPNKPRFVAGSVGPTNKTASMSPEVSNPAFRDITFDQLKAAFLEQIKALIEGGVDLLLIETSFDTLNVKAALMAAEEAMSELRKQIPLMVSFTIAGKSGRILSGQTLEAALTSIAHVPLLSVGLNCSFGTRDMKPFLKELGKIAPCYISAYPNAGLPNDLGGYDETPESMALQIREYLEEGLVNIIGGCCGTTPAHIKAIADLLKAKSYQPHQPNIQDKELKLSGLDLLKITSGTFVPIGERCNVAGSRKFLRLINEKNYEEALNIARKQIEAGAQVLDINLDDALLDGEEEMTRFLHLIASEPDIARVPVMIDSSQWKVIESGLKCLQGKAIVNSISLKNGEKDFLDKARRIRSYGAAVTAMAFDEKGQADTFERKIEVCERMYLLLTEKVGFPPEDIIFDPNVLAIATGIEEHNIYARDFIRCVEWIKKNLPGAKVSGGISNLSFSFRGNNYLREAMHTVFLYHATLKGLDMAIVNPSTLLDYHTLPADLRSLLDSVLLTGDEVSTGKLLEYAYTHNEQQTRTVEKTEKEWRSSPLDERLYQALLQGTLEYLEKDIEEALHVYPNPLDVIDQPLMNGLTKIGELFGEGKLFLPQLVKSARVMQRAVDLLQPAMEKEKKHTAKKAGKILFATVKGDVHDIGKNITSVILSCNNYEIIDLGVMVPAEEILTKAKEHQVDMIALSGLITPSLHEMAYVAEQMEEQGFNIPLMIGGATTSRLHTALKIDPLYKGVVIQVPDASQAVPVANKLLHQDLEVRKTFTQSIQEEYKILRETNERKKALVSLDYARKHRLNIDWSEYTPPLPESEDVKTLSIPVGDIIPYINWKAFLSAWKLPAKYAQKEAENKEDAKSKEAEKLLQDAQEMLAAWDKAKINNAKAVIGFFPVRVEKECLVLADKHIPFLRQQEEREDGTYKSLIDFIRPNGDYMGLFSVSVRPQEEKCSCGCNSQDSYHLLLQQTLCHRLAEAATEYVHEQVRKTYWGYAQDESYTPQELLKAPYRGIRPASGHPIHPDVSFNFIIDELLGMDKAGIVLTSNGAMEPSSSTAGMFIAHPQSSYFHLGIIDDEQLQAYAQLRNITVEEARRWLGI